MEEDAERTESIALTRVFPQPPSVVYDAWTKPEILRIWWKVGDGWTTDKVEADVEVGGGFVFGATEKKSGQTHVVRGVYHEVVPSKKLVFSFEVEGEESPIHEELVTVELSDLYGDTRMNLTHAKVRKGDPMTTRTLGWETTLGHLTGYLSQATEAEERWTPGTSRPGGSGTGAMHSNSDC